MKTNTAKGIKGEEIASRFLLEKGYIILEKNYRFRRAEIDIILQKENILVFVEVKSRSDKTFGEPELAVNNKKKILLRAAAENYIFENNWLKEIRFDIISITHFPVLEIVHFMDVD